MELRDYFAGKVLGGLFSQWQLDDNLPKECYRIADAMMKEREKGLTTEVNVSELIDDLLEEDIPECDPVTEAAIESVSEEDKPEIPLIREIVPYETPEELKNLAEEEIQKLAEEELFGDLPKGE